MEPWVLPNLLFPLEKQLQQWDIKVTNHDIPLVAGIISWKIVCYLMKSVAIIHFFYDTIIISREHLRWFILLRVLYFVHNSNCSHLFCLTDYGWFKKTQRYCVYWSETFTALLFSALGLFHRKGCGNFWMKGANSVKWIKALVAIDFSLVSVLI